MRIVDSTKSVSRRMLIGAAFWVVLGAVAGVLLVVAAVGRPAIGVIDLPIAISDTETTKKIVRMMDYARDSRDIKGVVLRIDSPGGSAVLVEEIYLALSQLRAAKPVVTTVDRMALSGGYYIGVASDYFYVKPTSFVGNIGVRMGLPDDEEVTEDQITTGPYKDMGISRLDAVRMLDLAKEGFVRVVMKERGERLKMAKDEVANGRMYLGLEAVKLGLVDRIGSTSDALDKAAALARVSGYSVVDIAERLDITLFEPFFFFQGEAPPAQRSVAWDAAPRIFYLDSDRAVR